jgi:hypothetical protein
MMRLVVVVSLAGNRFSISGMTCESIMDSISLGTPGRTAISAPSYSIMKPGAVPPAVGTSTAPSGR